MPERYLIKPLVWLVKDEASVRFHVEQDDYFGTIATIISLIRQRIQENPAAYTPDFKDALLNLENDLAWLQANYQIYPRVKPSTKIKATRKNQITPRIKKKKRIPKGKENNQ